MSAQAVGGRVGGSAALLVHRGPRETPERGGSHLARTPWCWRISAAEASF